jgi:uncharacterized protein YprB with RNaseH-like and TPR domain
MASGSLHDRLQRLRRWDVPPALELLEESLLGDTQPELPSLRARLERLVEVAVRKERRSVPARVPLEELVQGMRVENEHGEFFLSETSVHLEVRHGDVPLSRMSALDPATIPVLTGEPELTGFDLKEAVFLDTETTGLAGGAGTAAFLIGIGYVQGSRFVVRQYFMRDYHEEGALLEALARELQRFRQIVTFNGKMFDIPLLDARFRLNRGRFPLTDAPHLDLLHPARRLWKLRLDSCRLQSLEVGLLGLRRIGDIPGDQIPTIYFDWVRRRDARALARVFEHNRQDILSLAALAVLACQWVDEGQAEDPRDVFSLARVLERARLYDRCQEEYRRTLALDAGPLRGPALLRLAWRAKRARDWPAAIVLWEEAAAEGEIEALRELAMHHEHRGRDYPAALAVAERAVRLLASVEDDPRSRRLLDGFRRRMQRIARKLKARGKAACN